MKCISESERSQVQGGSPGLCVSEVLVESEALVTDQEMTRILGLLCTLDLKP